ncbi:RIP metalloprotease RseP [Erythrobacter sp. JK5]|uniref:RIP metalloprotease RseP n=1 Tax=Erythrobacter sp. JK5 TaxID=2829500 RepID=UPI001BA77EC3|nr:RIP metalloprotease RseP [Erythrobacter sp. JK5]QUL39118.1 RIP metalloprotease RseP [Erythrobacter sp. JK5]
MYAVGFLLLLGPLITVHELGHYLVGRWFGVKADAFSIGFGKEIAGVTDRHGTRWKLSILPLGGYVQFRGDMNPASVPDPDAPEEEGSFQCAALWKRALIVAAGPVTNILVALGIFFAFNLAYGKPLPVEPEQVGIIAAFTEDSRAREAGFEVGDRIVAIDGQKMGSWREIQQTILLYPNRAFEVTVVREGDRIELPVTAAAVEMTDRFGNPSTVGLIGIETEQIAERYEELGIGEAAALSVDQSVSAANMMVTGIAQIIRGDRSLAEMGGPVKIAKFSGEQLSLGLSAFVFFVALISLNLAFINLLPIPALDGGHLAFYAVEAIRRKPVGPQATEWAYRTGIAIVLMLMVVVTVNDVVSLPFFGS